MEKNTNHTGKGLLSYRIRIMGSIIAAQLLCLGFILFWPARPYQPDQKITFKADDVTPIQAPVRTRQQSSPPPPPAPKVPVPVPSDEPVVEEEIEFPNEVYSESSDSLSVTAGEGGDGNDEVVGNPEVGPSVVRIEEPTFENRSPEKASIDVTFLVDKKGNVEEAVIERILLYDEEGNPTIPVQQISDKDVVKKTIQAALNWKFRPAKVDGEPVRAYVTQNFIVDY